MIRAVLYVQGSHRVSSLQLPGHVAPPQLWPSASRPQAIYICEKYIEEALTQWACAGSTQRKLHQVTASLCSDLCPSMLHSFKPHSMKVNIYEAWVAKASIGYAAQETQFSISFCLVPGSGPRVDTPRTIASLYLSCIASNQVQIVLLTPSSTIMLRIVCVV